MYDHDVCISRTRRKVIALSSLAVLSLHLLSPVLGSAGADSDVVSLRPSVLDTPLPPEAEEKVVDVADDEAHLPPLTIQQAYDLVQDNNLDMAILDARLGQARAAAGMAWAAVLPNVSLQGNVRRTDPATRFNLESFEFMGAVLGELAVLLCTMDPDNQVCSMPPPATDGDGGGLGFEPPQTIYTGTIQVAVPILNPAGYVGIRGARAALSSAEKNIEYARREIMYAVTQTYYGALMASEMVGIARQTVEARRGHLQVARSLVEVGEQPAVAALRAEIQLTSAERDLEQALASRRNSKEVLRNLLRAEDDFRLVRPVIAAPPVDDVDVLVRQALEERRDVAAARERVAAAELNLRQSRYGYFPTVTGVGSFNVDNARQTRGADHPFSSVIMLTANVPIFQGNLRVRELEERRAALREAELSLTQLGERVESDIRQSVTDLATSRVVVDATARQVELAAENRRLVLASFAAGMATPVEVVDADTGLYAAQVGVLRDQLSSELAALAISRHTGIFPPPYLQ